MDWTRLTNPNELDVGQNDFYLESRLEFPPIQISLCPVSPLQVYKRVSKSLLKSAWTRVPREALLCCFSQGPELAEMFSVALKRYSRPVPLS